jgi:hypothetical protein
VLSGSSPLTLLRRTFSFYYGSLDKIPLFRIYVPALREIHDESRMLPGSLWKAFCSNRRRKIAAVQTLIPSPWHPKLYSKWTSNMNLSRTGLSATAGSAMLGALEADRTRVALIESQIFDLEDCMTWDWASSRRVLNL